MNHFGPHVQLQNSHTPQHFVSLGNLPFVVLVGLTGVGKSTTLEALTTLGQNYFLLPNRREITDVVMIEPHLDNGRTILEIGREERFEFTAQYRRQHPGGMAAAIGQLMIDQTQLQRPVVFDGLRGTEEVAYAAENYLASKFVLLDAPDTVRVERLLGRNDAFDKTNQQTQMKNASEQEAFVELKKISGIENVFKENELQQLAALTKNLPLHEVLGKTKIVVSERRNYDPHAAQEYLQGLTATRVLFANTQTETANSIAKRILDWV